MSKQNLADENKRIGESYLNKSCLFCKFKPKYIDAIPYLKKAADEYHGMNDWQSEIKTRLTLAKCFRATKSYWEEGNEYENIAIIRLNQLNELDEVLNEAQNAFGAYFNQHEYHSAFKCLIKISKEFVINKSNYSYAQKCLKITFDEIIKIFHVLALDKNSESIDYIYDAIVTYIDILVRYGQIEEGIKAANEIIKVIQEEASDDKNYIQKFNLIILGCYIILGDEEKYTEMENNCTFDKDYDKVTNLKKSLDKGNKKMFNNNMIDIGYLFPIAMCQKLNAIYKLKHNEEGNEGNEENEVVKDKDNKINEEDEEDSDDFK